MENNYMKKYITLATLIIAFAVNAKAQFCSLDTVSLDSASYTLGGTDTLNSVMSGNYSFSNYYMDYGSYTYWEGFAIANYKDDSTAGYGNQFSPYAGGDYSDTGNYAIYYQGMNNVGSITLTADDTLTGIYVTNSTYAALSMKYGDSFAKKFGGDDGTYEDYFLLHVIGSRNGSVIDTIDFYLADYRYSDNSEDYIIKDWTWLDLSSLDSLDKLEFAFSSTDTGAYGINTPTYFCLDNIDDPNGSSSLDMVSTFGQFILDENEEITGLSGSTNFKDGIATFPMKTEASLWKSFAYTNNTNKTATGNTTAASSCTGGGAMGTDNYAVVKIKDASDTIIFDMDTTINGMYVTNNAYAKYIMENATSGTEGFASFLPDNGDYLKLTVEGLDAGGASTGTVDFFLADSGASHVDTNYYVDYWKYMDLSSLGKVQYLVLSISSNRTHEALTYLCIDEVNAQEAVFTVKNLIDTLTVDEDAQDYSIYLPDYFYYTGYMDNVPSFEFKSSNTELVDNSFSNDTLNLEFQENSNGSGYFVVKASSYPNEATDTIYITVNSVDDLPTVQSALPDLDISPGTEVVTVGLSSVFTDVDNDDTQISKSISNNTNTSLIGTEVSGDVLTLTIMADQTGTADITVRGVSNGVAVEDVFTVRVEYPAGIDELEDEIITVSPNPFTDRVCITSGSQGTMHYQIYNAIGRLVADGQFMGSSQWLDLSKLKPGVYIIHMETPEGPVSKRIVKQ